MNREHFEEKIKKRVTDLENIEKDGVFSTLKGRVVESDYDGRKIVMEYDVTPFHKNGFNIMFGGSLVGMFDITFGTLTTALGDYDIGPTLQLNTSFLKGIPVGSVVRIEAEAVSVGKTIMNFMGKAFVGDELVGTGTGTFMTPKPFKPFVE